MIQFSLDKPFKVDSADAMADVGRWLAARCQPGEVVFLQGDLGVGKTTLARALIGALGYSGRVKSPTYGLIEVYPVTGFSVVHVDLYRLQDAQEVRDLGLDTLTTPEHLLVIEWPERGERQLPHPDWVICIQDWPDADADEASTQWRVVQIMGPNDGPAH